VAKRDEGQLGLFGGGAPSPDATSPAPEKSSRPIPEKSPRTPLEKTGAEDASEEGPKVLGVAEVDRRLQRMLERATARLLVRGEVRGLKRAGSGHLYFTLKDEREEAVLEAVMYRSTSPKARSRVVEGEQVVVAGRITLYPPRGRVQLIVNDVLQTARGALLEALERLKQKLAGEGLFDPVRKKPLPLTPATIALVTSRAGAAVHDFIRVAHQRGGGARIVVVDTPVQGATAPARIAGAIATADRYLAADVIVVTRGGGSLEDLAAFNDEMVVRAIAGAQTPVLSAVGHQIDQSLSDLAADGCAATPSQAAEMLVVDARARRQHLEALRARLFRSGQQDLATRRARLADLRAGLGDPRRLILMSTQRLDELRLELERGASRQLRRRRQRLEGLRQRLARQHPRRVLGEARERLAPLLPELERHFRRRLRDETSRLDRLRSRLDRAMETRLRSLRHDLSQRVAQLDALSPLAVLARGYAIARHEGHVLTDASKVDDGDTIEVMLGRGRLEATVVGKHD